MVSWRQSREYRVWRAQCIRRDKKCVICGSAKRRAVHHINNGAHHASQRYLPENGVTLCGQCHMNFHNNFKNSYREKTTVKDWNNFLTLSTYFKQIF